MSFFKKLKERVTSPKATVFLKLNKNAYTLGDKLEGTLTVSAEEEIDATEIRAEIRCEEKRKTTTRVPETITHSDGRRETQWVTRESWETEKIFSENPQGSGPLHLSAGYKGEFPISTTIPAGLKPCYSGGDGSVTWAIKGVIGVKGRPDVTSSTINIQVMEAPAIPAVIAEKIVEREPQPQQAQVSVPKPKLEACMHCAAPLTYDPEEVLVICGYCGYVNNTTGEQPPRYSMLPVVLNGSQAIEIAKEHAAKGVFVTKGMAESAEWGQIVLRYIPNWAVTIQLEGDLEGRKALIKTKDVKGQVAQEVAMQTLKAALGGLFGESGKDVGKALADRTERMSVSEAMDVPVVARKAAEFQPDAGAYKIPLDKKEPFKKTGEETLNVEISAQEATERAKGLALQEIRSRYTFVSRFSVGAYSVGEPELIYSPWWFIEYRMGGRSFSVIVDACNGSVVAGQRPWLPKGVNKKR